jgi:hypothetical protein
MHACTQKACAATVPLWPFMISVCTGWDSSSYARLNHLARVIPGIYAWRVWASVSTAKPGLDTLRLQGLASTLIEACAAVRDHSCSFLAPVESLSPVVLEPNRKRMEKRLRKAGKPSYMHIPSPGTNPQTLCVPLPRAAASPR